VWRRQSTSRRLSAAPDSDPEARAGAQLARKRPNQINLGPTDRLRPAGQTGGATKAPRRPTCRASVSFWAPFSVRPTFQPSSFNLASKCTREQPKRR